MVQKSVKKGDKEAERVELGIETVSDMRVKCKVKGM
jgi:hypothetical protein